MSQDAETALLWTEQLIKNLSNFKIMEPVRKIIEHATNPLTIELPEEYTNQKVEVIVLSLDEKEEQPKKKYDFSRFFGKLEWKGDALAEQRKLRDEWE